jgi:hypothetical protein
MIAMVVGGLLTGVFGLLASLSKQERTPHWICWCALAAGLVVIVAGLWAGSDNARDAEVIQKKIEENAELTKENAAFITGGDSYGYFFISPWIKNDVVTAEFIPRGKYPLYGLTVKITDLTKWELLMDRGEPGELIISKCTIRRPIGDISPNEDGPVLSLSVQRPRQKFKIEFIARNGKWTQDITMHYDERITPYRIVGTNKVPAKDISSWHTAMRVTRGPDILRERIDALFPKSTNGEIEW